MKFKIGVLVSSVIMLVSPLSGAVAVLAESNSIKFNSAWDYDTVNPGLGEYDQLLQNAGPTDGQVDWYPAEHFASSKNIRPSLLVKQLIELSIATTDSKSKARNVLFNNTTGTNNSRDGYEAIYKKYNLAFGFIAQLLDFDNEKIGKGAYLKQGFESTNNGQNKGIFDHEDKIAATDKNPDERILEIPKIGEGKNIADILGTAIFGDPDQSYAQLYVNGYDNTVQNAPNIIRETTTSITLVAQSKLTGRKATAIFKLNNKTFNELPEKVLLENNIDNSPSFKGHWGDSYNPDVVTRSKLGDSTNGTFNQKANLITGLTDSQKRLLSNGGSSAWVDPQTGSGTIVVPRGTSATEIAKKIKQLGYKSNYNIANVAPMKAIHGDKYVRPLNSLPREDGKARTVNNSYNVTFGGAISTNNSPWENPVGNVTALIKGDNAPSKKYFAVADPRLQSDPNNEDKGYVEDNIYKAKDLTTNFSNSLLYNPLNTNRNDLFGFFNDTYTNKTAQTIPNQKDTAVSTSGKLNDTFYDKPRSYASMYQKGKATIDARLANDKLGNVAHAFEPEENMDPEVSSKTPFAVREAWDDTHAIFGTAPFTGLTEEQIKEKIANNGSFNNTAGDQIKKSFTFNMPLDNTIMKSYRNPYSTVISTALPFSKSTKDFRPDKEYTTPYSGDMNENLKDSGKAGNYITDDGAPATNPWYSNREKNDSDSFSRISDPYGHSINVFAADGVKSRALNSLHLSKATWEGENTDSNKPRLINVESNKKTYNSLLGKDETHDNNSFASWIRDSKNSSKSDYDGDDWASVLMGHIATIESKAVTERGGLPTLATERYVDAGNDRSWNSTDTPGSNFETAPHDTGSTLFPHFVFNDPIQVKTDSHLQLAKNVGYVLISAKGLREDQKQTLSKYQIPRQWANTDGEKLNSIKNFADLGDMPTIYPVNDDSNYRGGLIGTMIINGHGKDNAGAVQQVNAGSIYMNPLSESELLRVPTRDFDAVYIKNDYLKTSSEEQVPKGENIPDSGSEVKYGLAWNDSSDLPQVKIERSLNVQYLVPVSVARKVTSTLTQNNEITNSSSSGGFKITRQVETKYNGYGLYLGDVKLSSDRKGVETNTDFLKKLLPVNNQIVYTRVDNSYPHYDSELFDHGSNRKSITATRDHKRNFVGNTEEIDTSGDNFTDGENKFVGSSDDYSIGIVHASQDLFKVDGDGVPSGTDGLNRKNDDVTSTQNKANGDRYKNSINKYADTPENNNGMSIGEPDSYITLAKAYNVDIVNGKAVGKADDQAKNKDDRVALVQQLLDNGGNAGAYYYIPSLPRLYEHWNEARINVVIYDQAAVPAPSKPETKPSFSTTDVSKGKDPFGVSLRPYTTVYDDGAVLKGADVPQSFKNLLNNILVANNPNLINNQSRLQQVLVDAFLDSWQQNDGSFNQTDTGAGVNSPLYLYGGFGISNSDSKNSYSQWPDGYATPTSKTSKYYEAVSRYPGDFYRGGKDLKTMGKEVIKGIPASALQADVSQVDLTKAGSYPVVFTYTNPDNAKDTAKITVPITVKDAAAPVFAFQGGSDTTLKVGESFDRNAFKVVGSWQIFNKYEGSYDKLVNYEGIAKDSKGEPEVTILGDVDTQTPGVYQLTYKATSVGGATTTMTRNITVLPKETSGDNWQVNEFASVGYINYVPNYGINVWNAPAGVFTGQRLAHGSAWKIFKKATNAQGKVFYNVGKNQWIDGQYVAFSPVVSLKPLKGIVTIDYVPGYGVNLWKAPNTSGGYYAGRKLKHGTQWKTFGLENGFYKVGNNQWIQGKYAKFQAK